MDPCPLDCAACGKSMTTPVRLPCQHCFCKGCLTEKRCPTCSKPTPDPSELKEDSILAYLLASSREEVEACANCDRTIQPMYYCETCQQPLCVECTSSTHQARIFANHHIVDLEECGRDRGKTLCSEHNEPFILFCLDQRKLMCIECFNSSSIDKRHNFVNIEIAHKMCFSKLEKQTNKLKAFQEELKEHIDVRKRVLDELDGNYAQAESDVESKYAEIIAKIGEIKSEVVSKIREERQRRESELKSQLEAIASLMNPIKLNLLSVSVFCSAASKIDLLHCYGDLVRSIQTILNHETERVNFSGEVLTDYRDEFVKAVERAFSWHQVLIPPPPPPPKHLPSTSVATISPINRPKSALHTQMAPISCKSRSSSPSGSSYTHYITATASSNGSGGHVNGIRVPAAALNQSDDLSGAFGAHFERVATPLKELSLELAYLSKNLIEVQRDITMRRCVVKRENMEAVVTRCEALEQKVFQHVAVMDGLQPVLREGWQEQLDRVRRQQGLFKQKLHEVEYLQEYAARARQTAHTLRPFAFYMASVIAVTDSRRSELVELAPMEKICLQITNLEPDSAQRVEAIEKEEEGRRVAREAAKEEEQRAVREAKEKLKATREGRGKRKSSVSTSSVVVENSRDRNAMGSVVTRASMRRQKLEARALSDDASIRSTSPRDLLSSPTFSESINTPLTSPAPSLFDEPIHEASPPLSIETRSKSIDIPESISPSIISPSPSPLVSTVPISVIPPPPPPPPPQGIVVPISNPSAPEDLPSPTAPSMLKRPMMPACSGANSPSYETVLAREQLLEAIKERFKKTESAQSTDDS
uniref:RING finger protein 207 n=1 Tax=Panagrellus redivivus TaxID=6233 RepID=A0A7E4V9N8_PANRE